jgi:hypothetical protein
MDNNRIQIYKDNRRYWQYKGNPVLLLGGSVEDNLFQIPDLKEHLELLASVGGNYIRNTMSSRDRGNVQPFKKVNGKYDLDQWNEEYWNRLQNMLKWTQELDVIPQIEVWAFHDFNQRVWKRNPWNSANNVNYTASDTTLKDHYGNIGRVPHDFFCTVPKLNNDEIVLSYQQKFVDKMLSYTLEYDHVLYCMTNEIHPNYAPEWGWYWSEYIKAKAADAGVKVETTEMLWETNLKAEQQRASLDHPEIYSYFEASQNSANAGQRNWDNLQFVYNYIASKPRPINHVKIYGADDSAWEKDTDRKATESFWRNIIGGSASSRFHRPPYGLGLSEKSQAHIKSMRMLTDEMDIFTSEPHNDLLSNRKENGAYATANPGKEYVVYFPNGEPVDLDLSGVKGSLKAKWLDIEQSEWAKEETLEAGGTVTLTPPGKGHWAVLATICFTNTTELLTDKLSDLRVSENGRFLVRKDGSGFFPLADTAWAIAWRLDRDEVEKYLRHRRDQKFNAIALIAFPSYGSSEVIVNVYGDNPFEANSGKWDPLRPIIKPSGSYDYWDHLEYIIDVSESKGMYVILLPTWGSYVAGSWGGENTSEIIFNSTNSYKYGRWIGQRFKNKKNIIWMMGGDRNAVYDDKDYRSVFQAMAEGVADGVNGINQQDTKADYSTTLMSYHPRKYMPNSSEWFHNDPWLDFNSIQDQPKDQITAIELDYGLSPAKPTWLFEGRYEKLVQGNNIYKDWQIRFQSYQTVFAGGFGVTYGHMNVFGFGIGDVGKSIDHDKKWENSLDDPGAIDMQHLLKLMTSLSNDQFLDRIPDQSLIDGDEGGMDVSEGVRSNRLQATCGSKGDYAMVYSANGRNICLKMNRLAAPLMNAFWFNPRNGKWRIKDRDLTDQRPFVKNIHSGPGAPIREFDPPGNVGNGNDWVLVLMAVK